MSKIALISCTKVKRDRPCEVQVMYAGSTLFSKIIRFVEHQNYNNWYVLSAKYSLLTKDQMIEPYNVTLNSMKIADRKEWADHVARQILALQVETIDFYAGQKYREFIIPILEEKNVSCIVPLIGLGIGQQLKYLTSKTSW